jgi:hypothetical protein
MRPVSGMGADSMSLGGSGAVFDYRVDLGILETRGAIPSQNAAKAQRVGESEVYASLRPGSQPTSAAQRSAC